MYKSENNGIRIYNRRGSHSALRILFVHNSLPEYRVGWFQELSSMCQVKFIITNPQLASNIYGVEGSAQGLDIVKLNSGIKGYQQILYEIKNIEKYDFVELPPMDSLGEWMKSALFFCFARKKGVKVGYFWEKWEAPGEIQPIKRRLKNTILKLAGAVFFRRVDLVFAGGSKSKEYFQKAGVKEERIVVIPDTTEMPCITEFDIREKYNIPKDRKIVLYFGRMVGWKGLNVLLNAIAQLEQEVRDKLFLVAVGDGGLRADYERQSLDLGLNCCFVGTVPPENRYTYFSQCDIYVHPGCFFEGMTEVWGLTLNEAVQCGKIIISTTAVGSAYDLITEKNGRMVEAGNVAQLMEAIRECVGDEELQWSAKEEGARLYNRYNYPNMAQEYLGAIKGVLEEGITVGGIPAKKISNHNSDKFIYWYRKDGEA